jgi:uncharacterized protein with HEPN domain
MNRDRTVFLRHMLICIDRIADYTREGRAVFMSDSKTQDAVVRNLEVLGQATKDFGTEELRARDPSIPWSRIAALRNVLAHQYLGVDVTLVWNIVERELVGLRSVIEGVLRNLTDGSEDEKKS